MATQLLACVLEALEALPHLRRQEAQLITFGVEPLGKIFLARGFQTFPRLFMYAELGAAAPATAVARADESHSIEFRGWRDSYFEAMAELIVDAYAGHVDSRINNQYSEAAGALRFLKNIVIFPGCGIFQPEASWVAVEPSSGCLLGAALSSRVAPRVGHITQVCVRRKWQGEGLGRRLMARALRSFQTAEFEGVSLTVTADNTPAVQLYQKLGFQVIKGFAAFARDVT